MARASEVRYAQVSAACANLFRNGESVSFAKVYAAIGSKGGQAVVSEMIRRWRAEIGEKLLTQRTHPTLPSELVEQSDTLISTLWQMALTRGAETYEQAVGELAMKESEWSLRLEKADAHVADKERQLLALVGEIKTLQATIAARDKALVEMEARNRELAAALAVKDDQVVGFREDLARTLTSLEAERNRHAVALQAKDEQHALELAGVQERAEGDRRHLMMQTDEIRQAAKLTADNLRAQLESEKLTTESFRGQAYKARDDASRWQGRAEVAQEELAEANRLLAKIRKNREKTVLKVIQKDV